MMNIIESKMEFGPFCDDRVFQIEKSDLHQKIGSGVKTVEFLLCKGVDSLSFVEAKSSSPQPGAKNEIRFQEFVDEITQKFIHSFNLYYSTVLGRHSATEDLPAAFSQIVHKDVRFKFILVIRGHETEWLAPIKAALDQAMLTHGKIWASNVIVLNDELAKRWGLISRVVA